jgi:hypothetical protein
MPQTAVATDTEAATFSGRIKAGMMRVGMEAKPAVLMRAWKKRFGERLTPSRPVFYDWFKAKTPRIDIANLYRLSDVLEVGARWLALGDSRYLSKAVISPDPELGSLIEIYNDLRPGFQDELRAHARELLRLQKTLGKDSGTK